MKSHSNSVKTFNKQRNKPPRSNVLELDYNRNLPEFSKTIENLKELKINHKQDLFENEEDDISVLYYEDTDLREMVNSKEFADKDFNIVNNFLRIEEEENIINKENIGNNNMANFNNPDNDVLVLNQLNHKILLDEEFQPGLFTSFNFKDKIKSLLYNSLTMNNSNNSFKNYTLNESKETSSEKNSDFDNEDIGKGKNDDGYILDMCIKDKDMESDNIIINFNEDEEEEEVKASSILDEEKTNFEGFKKTEAIPEYENQIISYQNYYQKEHKQDFSYYPIIKQEFFDRKLFDYMADISKNIKDKELKNKIKLIIKLILFKEPKSKKYVFDNKEKNELLLYWKNSYIKELKDATDKEKNRIVLQKLESLDPNTKLFEITKKMIERRRSQVRLGQRGSYFLSLRDSNSINNSKRKIRKKNKSVARRYPKKIIKNYFQK